MVVYLNIEQGFFLDKLSMGCNFDVYDMSLKEVQFDMGFADSEILGCERINSLFKIKLRAWNAKIIQIRFSDVQLVLDLMAGDVSGIFLHDQETELLRKALAHGYDEQPKKHPYHHYAFLNNDDRPCLEIVADEINVTFE